MKRFFKRLSNRGSTFVIVITTIGFVGVITSLVLMVTSSGYQTKAIDNQAKNNFYSAEEIVDQIKTGIHNDMSKAIMKSYFETLTDYYKNNFANEEDSTARKRALAEVNLNYKKNAVGDAARGTGFIGMIQDGLNSYNVKKTVLESYISADYLRSKDSNVQITIGAQKKVGAGANITFETAIVEEMDMYTGATEVVEYGIVIRNIGITYVNELGYTNNVYTDIKMYVPDLDLSHIDLDRNIDFARYGIMTQKDLILSEGAGVAPSAIVGNFWVGDNLNITGGARLKTLADYGYIGKDLNLNVNAATKAASAIPTNGYMTDAMFEMNILTGTNGYYSNTFRHNNGSCAASKKLNSLKNKSGNAIYEKNMTNTAYAQMYINNTSKTKKINTTSTYLAVDDILMNDTTVSGTNTKVVNTINTDTNLLVKNDMLFNVDFAHAEIRNTYRGYGYSHDRTSSLIADHNSSIILNNKNCDLNMDLRGLTILGSAFIKTDKTDNDDYKFPYAEMDILTGDSLIVRGNQIAYLVPAKYVPGFNTNPVTSAEAGSTDLDAFAVTIMDNIKHEENALVTKYFSQNLDNFVVPILYSYGGDGSSNYVVYYYFNFANASLAADYYKNGEDKHGNKLVSAVTKKTLLGLIPAKINVDVESPVASDIMGNHLKKLESDDTGVLSEPDMGDSGVAPTSNPNTSAGMVHSKNVVNMRSFLRKSVPKSIEDEEVNDAGENTILNEFKSRDAIDNIVDWSKVYLEATPTASNPHILNKQYTLNGKSAKVILTKSDYMINNGGTKENYLLITTGDVYISNNSYVGGLILAKGNIRLGYGVTVESADDTIEDIFRNAAMYRTPNDVLFSQIFRGYDYDRKLNERIDIRNYMIDLNGMFTYENWSRQ